MKVSPDILQSELIGLRAKVAKSLHADYLGIKGKVIDETRKTLVILHGDERKTVAKDVAVFTSPCRMGRLWRSMAKQSSDDLKIGLKDRSGEGGKGCPFP